MKILRYALLGLICLVPLTALSLKYTNIPTDGYIGIIVFDKDDKGEETPLIAQSDAAYFISGYTYDYLFQEDEHELVLRIPEIDRYSMNHTNYTKIKDWIEWTEETKGIDICENITEVPNKKHSWKKDALLTFKNAVIYLDQHGAYEDKDNKHNVKIIGITTKTSIETTDNQPTVINAESSDRQTGSDNSSNSDVVTTSIYSGIGDVNLGGLTGIGIERIYKNASINLGIGKGLDYTGTSVGIKVYNSNANSKNRIFGGINRIKYKTHSDIAFTAGYRHTANNGIYISPYAGIRLHSYTLCYGLNVGISV